MEITKIEVTSNKTKGICIRPFVEDDVENMGLENYNMVVYDDVTHIEPVKCLEANGVKRYITGLNEYAPTIKSLPDAEREAKVKEIRTTVSQLEKELNSNIVDVKDKEFWNKIELLHPKNSKFWDNINIEVGNQPVYLDLENPYDLIKYHAIIAGGFNFVAPSLKEAQASPRPPKFYLDRFEQTASGKNAVRKLRNKALALLQEMFDTDTNKLMYVTKVLETNSVSYTKSTPPDILYDDLDAFIHGKSIVNNKEEAARSFIAAATSEMQDLIVKSMVKDSLILKFITPKPDGFMYVANTDVAVGRGLEDSVVYLQSPANEDIYDELRARVEEYWKK